MAAPGAAACWLLVVGMVVAFVPLVEASATIHLPELDERPILFVDDLQNLVHYVGDDAIEYLMNMLPSIDTGLDHHGKYTGNAGNGGVDAGELAIRLVRVELDRQLMDSFYRRADADLNQDDLVTFEELIESNSTFGLDVPVVASRFNAADENKDGWLSLNEVANFFYPQSHPIMFRALASTNEGMLHGAQVENHTQDENTHNLYTPQDQCRFDRPSDHNSKLDKGEVRLRKIQEHFPGYASFPFDLAHLSQRLDGAMDEDGYLSLSELMHWFDGEYDARIAQHVAKIFAQVDTDQDGELSPTEIREHHAVLIGDAEARKYGVFKQGQVDLSEQEAEEIFKYEAPDPEDAEPVLTEGQRQVEELVAKKMIPRDMGDQLLRGELPKDIVHALQAGTYSEEMLELLELLEIDVSHLLTDDEAPMPGQHAEL
ncbi:uncharacterized protein MONBRDRAFT_29827 [Monosiga brevicollis MX1]|uniref:EF-hand domain-containing protein n=1 Tax=Monosiga brevicollis TaxID=81824 RepID=A9VC86_MONBE|nr:uncharacterized protein MONBRDRAFT_29827 [Monosiga brevicollis MX1]EDQ84816.1 predicted protein [Monosiga brevicollis MX1]|eukprot:XP_001750317.1 hypothetical protein [Monosiga brevicollis MX1]